MLEGFADTAEVYGRTGDAEALRRRAASLARIVDQEAWDGDWYLRATFDDGTPIGSATSPEAQIDSLPQAWAWFRPSSAPGDPERARRAVDAAWERLVMPRERLALLFAPPFEKWDKDPGYIRGYPPGVRENGGQYTHAAVWLAIALARLGDGARAVALLDMLNPVTHALDPEGVARYAVEPYAVAGDVYSLPGRVGRGGWTWYTGAAGWMYRAWVEEVLGLRVRGDTLTVRPVIPPEWPGFTMRYRHGEAVYAVVVENPDGVSSGVAWVELDGRRLADGLVPLEDAPLTHSVTVRMGG
jgi:cyclic beta-1,2-glucan synthetase